MHFITNGYTCFSKTNSTDPMQRVPLNKRKVKNHHLTRGLVWGSLHDSSWLDGTTSPSCYTTGCMTGMGNLREILRINCPIGVWREWWKFRELLLLVQSLWDLFNIIAPLGSSESVFFQVESSLVYNETKNVMGSWHIQEGPTSLKCIRNANSR